MSYNSNSLTLQLDGNLPNGITICSPFNSIVALLMEIWSIGKGKSHSSQICSQNLRFPCGEHVCMYKARGR